MERSTSRKLSVLRLLAVASVVVYHAYPLEPPFLGLVSGYLFFRTFVPTLAGYVSKLRTRMRTLLVPFLIWSGLGGRAQPQPQPTVTVPAGRSPAGGYVDS